MLNPIIDRGASQDRIDAQTSLAESLSARIVVANSTTDLQLTMGAGLTTGRMFYIESDQNITIKFNGTDAARALNLKVPSTSVVGILYMEIDFTSVYISNGSGTSANVYYAVVGS